MKISLALGPRRPLSRQTAWGCLTSNVAIPGVGSLMAGRPSGYVQLALAFTGLAMTTILTARLFIWYGANMTRLTAPDVDPIASVIEMWQAFRWPLLSIALFAMGWLWGLATGLAIVREAKAAECAGSGASKAPPKLF